MTTLETEKFVHAIHAARTVAGITAIEARAARLYWGRFEIRLEARNRSKLPVHWRTSAGRASSLGPGPKRATHPLNAMLNYAYSIELGRLAAALHASGACLAIGFLHGDKPGRMSLAYDALEPLRPIIGAAVAKWIASRKFAA